MRLLDDTTFDRLADDLLDRLPVVGARAREVGLALYHLLAEGAPVTCDQVAQRVGRNPEDVARVLEELRGLVYSEGENIIGFGEDHRHHRLRGMNTDDARRRHVELDR